MYYAAVALLMFILPAVAIVWDSPDGASFTSTALLKWYVFFAVGCRLALAGLSQVVRPAYTANEILRLQGPTSLIVVRELGFANFSIGTMAMISLCQPHWREGAALAGGCFYTLAGAVHLCQHGRDSKESVAMVSDLFAGAVLLWGLSGSLFRS